MAHLWSNVPIHTLSKNLYFFQLRLKRIIKQKIEELQCINKQISHQETKIKKLKRKLRRRREIEYCNENDGGEVADETESAGVGISQGTPEGVKKEENVEKTDAEVNPDDYVACSIQ